MANVEIEQRSSKVFVHYTTTIRVEVDPRSMQVTEVVVDQSSMVEPSVVIDADGQDVVGVERDVVESVVANAEWPSWDYALLSSVSSEGEFEGTEDMSGR